MSLLALIAGGTDRSPKGRPTPPLGAAARSSSVTPATVRIRSFCPWAADPWVPRPRSARVPASHVLSSPWPQVGCVAWPASRRACVRSADRFAGDAQRGGGDDWFGGQYRMTWGDLEVADRRSGECG